MSWQQQRTLETGARPSDFELEDLKGQVQSLKHLLAGGPVLLAFFKISCPVCQLTFPYLQRLHESAGGKLHVVGVSQDDSSATTRFNGECGVAFPTLIDRSGYPVSNAFGIQSVPSLFLVEPDGKISLAGTGFSKKDLETIGARLGATPFRPGEKVPEYKPG